MLEKCLWNLGMFSLNCQKKLLKNADSKHFFYFKQVRVSDERTVFFYNRQFRHDKPSKIKDRNAILKDESSKKFIFIIIMIAFIVPLTLMGEGGKEVHSKGSTGVIKFILMQGWV